MSKYKIHPLLEKRWSPRAFSDKPVTEEDVNKIFTGASWAASARNEQPWKYVYGLKGTPGFDRLWECLLPGNQPWTKNAAVLFVALQRHTFESNGKTNKKAMHDVGLANAQLLLQAVSVDIYGHLMAGYDAGKAKETLRLNEDMSPVCMGALGYLGDANDLEEPFKSREREPRTRKPLEEFVTKL
ncbi:nitroreductase family protein [Draconibacterium halophilum]|uniref:Nitroreductase n=1 Tax=Draconibacterium halophilum TaxID=2706887 RepID=A0A6C0RF56_9BACT|nr:nitroreductase family protein [Draconibacterium halophilum]QIA09030.1 nitroreductase [Draconibacterium halophilum]